MKLERSFNQKFDENSPTGSTINSIRFSFQAKITAELGELIENDQFIREVSQGKLTIFKSVGMALEDLAAAIVLHESKPK